MLKTRVIPVLLYDNVGNAVKGVAFEDNPRRVGTLMQHMQLNVARGVDELFMLDVTATKTGAGPNLGLIELTAKWANMPLAVGGGIKTVEQATAIIKAGAEKVVIGYEAFNYDFIKELSKKFGKQAVVVAIDVKWCEEAQRWRHGFKDYYNIRVAVWHAQDCEEFGAGEILLTSTSREGTFDGYDLDLIRTVSPAVSIPVVAHGGAGTPLHCLQAIQAGAHAVAAGSMFHFTEITPKGVKLWLDAQGVPVRLD